MKSERRHELQQNILASYLGRINRSIEPYSRMIAVVLAVVIVGAITIGLLRSKASGDRSEATLHLIQAVNSPQRDPEVLESVGADFPDTAAGAWSRLYQGDEYLSKGIAQLFTSRADAMDLLEQSKIAFEAALAASDDSLLRSRANFGIGRAAESRGDIEDAVAAYKDCIAVNESKEMIEKAQERIDSLASPETKQFLTWFSDQDFTPAEPSLPPSLPDAATIPAMPDLKLPKIGGAASDRDLGEGLEMPEKTDAKDADAKGADAKDADAKDADAKDADAKDADAKDADAKDADAKDADAKDADAKDADAKDADAKDADAKDTESKDVAGKDESATEETTAQESEEADKTEEGGKDEASETEPVSESAESESPPAEEAPQKESQSEADGESAAGESEESAAKDAESDQE